MTTRRVLVTGATSGIGAGIARAFAAAGDALVATGATNAEVVAARGQPGIDVRQLDVRDGDAVRAFVEGLGELDVVVNCAGVIRRGAELDPDAFAETVDRDAGDPRRRTGLGAPGARRLVPSAAAEHGDGQLVQPAARAQVGRAVAPHPPVVGHRLLDPRRVALPRARLGRQGRLVRLRTAGRDPHAGGRRAGRRHRDDHVLQHPRRDGLCRRGRQGHRLRRRVHQDRDVHRKHYVACGLGEAYVDTLVR